MKYDAEAWERLGSTFNNNYQFDLPWRHFVIKILSDYDSDIENMLDVACCTGWYIKQLRTKHFEAAYHGVDITPNLVERAKEANPGEKFQQGDIRSLDLPNDSFDLVFAGGVLMHLAPEDAPKAMSELFRVSRKYVFVYTYGSQDKTVENNDDFYNVFYSLADLKKMVPAGWNLNKKLFVEERWFLEFIQE